MISVLKNLWGGGAVSTIFGLHQLEIDLNYFFTESQDRYCLFSSWLFIEIDSKPPCVRRTLGTVIDGITEN